MVVNVSLNNRHSKVPINMTSQVNINSKTESIVIPCQFLMCRWWRWLHCFEFNPGPCTWDVSHDVCVHVPVKCILCALQNPVNRIPFLAWKSVFQLYRPDYTPLSALPGCAPIQQYLLPFSMKTWLFVPLANDWHCVDAHDRIALHILWPLFIIPSDSSLGRWMGNYSPGRIKRRPIEALAISATHKSPSRIQR